MISDHDAQKLDEQSKRELIHEYFLRLQEYNRNKSLFKMIKVFTAFLLIACVPFQRIDLYLAPVLLFFILHFLSQSRLPVSETQIDNWLDQDRRNLYEETRELLKIKTTDSEHFSIWSPVDPKFVEIKYEQSELANLKEPPVFISDKDYFAERGIDGKIRFGVYSFGLIFTTETSLAYFKCYWNFVRGAAVGIQYGDYIYASIASVGYKEESESSGKKGFKQRVLRSFLRFTTDDSRETTFVKYGPFDIKYSNNIIDVESDESTQLKHIQLELRRWVRQRRTDYQRVKIIGHDN